MYKIQSIIVLLCLGMIYASSYGNSFNTANYYPYTGSYVGANSGSHYSSGYSGYGYRYGNGGYGPSVYNKVIVPHPYPVPYPVHSGAMSGSRYLVLRNGVGQNNGLFGIGDGGIFGKTFLKLFKKL